jgi:hypothetical protein
MMSCPVFTVWSHPILSLCCTEHGPPCGAILSGHIIVVAMSKSDQLGRRCTVEMHYIDLHVFTCFSNARA